MQISAEDKADVLDRSIHCSRGQAEGANSEKNPHFQVNAEASDVELSRAPVAVAERNHEMVSETRRRGSADGGEKRRVTSQVSDTSGAWRCAAPPRSAETADKSRDIAR